MREMKNSGIEWIGEIPVGWEVKKAKRIFKERNEKGNEISLQLLSPSQKYGVIPQSELDSVVKVKENTDLSTFKTIHAGDYCISLRSFQGGFEYSVYEGVVSPAYHVFYANIDINHIYYKFLFKCVVFIEKIASLPLTLRDGKNISFAMFGDIVIPIPPLEEQHRISTYLDTKCEKIDSIIARQQEVIEKLKAYKLSVITEAVTKGLNPDVRMKDSGVEWIGDVPEHWEIGKVGYFTTKIGSGKTPKGGAEIYVNDGVLFLRSQNIYDDGLRIEDATYITEEIDNEMINTRVYKNDVLLNITGGSIGRACIYNLEEHANVNQHVCIIRTINTIVTPEFMHYFWISDLGHTSINICQTGANREGMNFEQISKTPIPIMSLMEQLHICDYLDKKCSAIDSAIAKKQAIIEKLTAYKKSLIYEVVTGKREV